MSVSSSGSLVSEKRIELAKRYAARLATSPNGTEGAGGQRERKCWLCARDLGSIVYDKKDLCIDCAEDFLRFGLMPLMAEMFARVDVVVEQKIRDAETKLQPVLSPVSSPLMKDVPGRSSWTCVKCKSILDDAALRCTCCGQRRPNDPLCPRCGQNVLSCATCTVTHNKHKIWTCTPCSNANIDEAVECRACRTIRTWFCAACSLENPWSHRYCDACGGSNRLDSLSTLVNRDFLSQMGFGAESASMHREQQQKVEHVKEHTARLNARLDHIGLLPIPIGDDGNCLFRSISYQLTRTDVFYPTVRHAVADYMEAHRDEYALLIGGDDVDAYISGMRRSGVWGDELCVHAASRAFGVTIHVITSEENRWHLQYDPLPSSPESQKQAARQGSFTTCSARQLFLCYRSPDHYFCVVLESLEQQTRTVDLDTTLRAWGGSAVFAIQTRSAGASASVSASSAVGLPASSSPTLPPATRTATIGTGLSSPPLQQPSFVHLAIRQSHTQQASEPPLMRRGHADSLPATSNSSRGGLVSSSGAPHSITERPMTRSLRSEVLAFSQLHLLHQPIMVQLCVSSSDLNIGVKQERVIREQEGAYFYLYVISPKAIIDGGPRREPWCSVYQQTLELRDAALKRSHQMMPLFLLQDSVSGGFLCPTDELALEKVFNDYQPVRCCELRCRYSRNFSSCLLTVDDLATQSRSKVYLKFYSRALAAPCVAFYGDKPLFCCELPVQSSTVVIHQLFSGRPERLCLRCRQWYEGGHSADVRMRADMGACRHHSYVDDTLEILNRY